MAVVTLMSCVEPPRSARATAYVGTVDDLDGPVSIGLAVQDNQAALFACSDDPTSREYPGWLSPGDYGGDGEVRLGRNGWSFVGAMGPDGAQGTLVGPDGTAVHWSGKRADGATASGLYSTFDSGCTTGVVVVDNGPTSAPVVRGAWCSSDGTVSQVIVAGSRIHLVDGKLPVEVALGTGLRRLDLAPVKLPLAQ